MPDCEHCECDTCGADPVLTDQIRRNDERIDAAKQRDALVRRNQGFPEGQCVPGGDAGEREVSPVMSAPNIPIEISREGAARCKSSDLIKTAQAQRQLEAARRVMSKRRAGARLTC